MLQIHCDVRPERQGCLQKPCATRTSRPSPGPAPRVQRVLWVQGWVYGVFLKAPLPLIEAYNHTYVNITLKDY